MSENIKSKARVAKRALALANDIRTLSPVYRGKLRALMPNQVGIIKSQTPKMTLSAVMYFIGLENKTNQLLHSLRR